MRHSSRIQSLRSTPNLLHLEPMPFPEREEAAELSAFRGLLISASASALFWGAFITVIWLARTKG